MSLRYRSYEVGCNLLYLWFDVLVKWCTIWKRDGVNVLPGLSGHNK